MSTYLVPLPLGTRVRLRHHPDVPQCAVVAYEVDYSGVMYKVQYLDKLGVVQDKFFNHDELEVLT